MCCKNPKARLDGPSDGTGNADKLERGHGVDEQSNRAGQNRLREGAGYKKLAR